MTVEAQLRLSYYRALGFVDQSHGVKLVQHIETGKIFVMKELKIYDIRVYTYLLENPSPGIPLIEELIETEDALYVIEEYISGDSLREILDRQKTLSEAETIAVILDLCAILEPLHALSSPIVHRDIKPGNIILTRDRKPMLIDFNSAKEANASQDRDTVLIGTAGYAAPEQYGFSSSKPSADIYAIGMLMNELLTGTVSNKKIAQGRLRPILQKCLQMDPARRFSSVQDLRREIQRSIASPLAEPEKRNGSFLFLPGFRSRNIILNFLGLGWYIFIFWFSFHLEMDGTVPASLLMFRITIALILFAETLWVGNYLNLHKKMPISCSENPLIRTLGVAFWAIFLIAASLFIFIVMLLILFPE